MKTIKICIVIMTVVIAVQIYCQQRLNENLIQKCSDLQDRINYIEMLHDEAVRTQYVEKYLLNKNFGDCFPASDESIMGDGVIIYIPPKSCSDCFSDIIQPLFSKFKIKGKTIHFFIQSNEHYRFLLSNLGVDVKDQIYIVNESILSRLSKPCLLEFDERMNVKKAYILNSIYEKGENEMQHLFD